jgi:hypothetical protein
MVVKPVFYAKFISDFMDIILNAIYPILNIAPFSE